MQAEGYDKTAKYDIDSCGEECGCCQVLDMGNYMRKVEKIPRMRVQIWIRNGVVWYGHSEDHVRPAQPITSPGWKLVKILKNGGDGFVPSAPTAKMSCHHVRYMTDVKVCTSMLMPNSTENAIPAPSEGS